MRSPYRYSKLDSKFRKFWRNFFPMPVSSYTEGRVQNICAVQLVPPDKLISSFESYIELLYTLRGPDIGSYMEFGVFNGSSMFCMHQALKNFGIRNPQLFGFDSFEGLQPGVENSNHGVFKPGFYKCSYETMCNCLHKRGLDPDKITWIPGWFDQTLNQIAISKYGLENPGIVFIDCDSYEASKTVLDFIAPLIKKPIIICLDDWSLYDLDLKEDGEYRSFNEFLENNPHLRADRISTYIKKAKVFLIRP